jgi:radical SAM superfamily enzyme YgiQ (UPF0313 family)
MALSSRRIALVCMTPASDANEHGDMELPSYGVRRILAAVLDDPALAGVQCGLIDVERPDVEAYVEAIESMEPDLVGFSVYVWSTPCLVEVARRIKRRRPNCIVVFGGPSARTAMFDLPPYSPAHAYADALVASEGEDTFREIAKLPNLTPAALRGVTGLDIPTPGGWIDTGHRAPLVHLDQIASPYQIGVMDKNTVAYLETYRGCPFSCTFCEWGATKDSKAVFSVDYLTRELEAYARHRASAIFLVDAGLNLNHQAFRNLREAESRVGVLKTASFWSEIYPSLIKDEHLEFLTSVRAAYLGIGLQSTDPAVLKSLQRPFDQKRLDTVVRQVANVAKAELQVIFGLPGDTPAGFRRTLETARSMPVSVRAYGALVLPDAFMTRSKPEWNVRYDPVTLKMTSCLGWSEDELREMRAWISAEAHAAGGKAGDYWWFFPRQA